MVPVETKFGVVIFDKPEIRDAGWSCQWQDEKTQVTRVSGTGELSSDTVWLTNLSYEANKQAGLSGLRFRRGDYFNHSLEKIWAEVGFAVENSTTPLDALWGGRYKNHSSLIAAYSAWLFRQTVLAGNAVIPVRAPVLPIMPHGLSDLIIPSRMDEYFYQGKSPTVESIRIMSQADLVWQPVSQNRKANDSLIQVRLRPNRVAQAIIMLSSPWPISCKWGMLTNKDLASRSSNMEWVDQWVRENPMSILRVTVRQTMDHEIERLINFGANIKKKSEQNKWITSDDYLRIRPYCIIEVHQIAYTDKSITGMDWLDRLDGFLLKPSDVSLRAGSYSFGLMMEMLWRAMLLPPRDYQKDSNPAATFLRGHDRKLLFPSVVKLNEMGINVKGYGSGYINAEYDPSTLNATDFAKIVVGAGLNAPWTAKGTIDADTAIKIATEHENHRLGEAARRLEAAQLMGDLQTLVDMDEALSTWTSD